MSSKKLHIAIFSGELPSTTFIEHLINGVASTHRVLLFGVKRPSAIIAYKDDVKMHITPQNKFKNLVVSLYRSFRLLLKRPKELMKLWKEVKRFKSRYDRWIWLTKFLPIVLYRPDVLHLQWTRDLEFYTFFKTKFNIPLIVSLRGAHVNYTPIVEPKIAAVYKETFPHVDAFHAVSEAIVREASKYGDIESRTRVIHSPVPNIYFNQFLPYAKNEKNTINIVSIGRFHWVKGFRYAIDTLAQLKDQGYDVHYTIVGPNAFPEALTFQINQLKIKDSITLKGKLPQNEVLTFLQTQDVLLLPSLQEGIANVVLEAMAIGLPVVSTDCGGMSEVVIHKKTGWLVPIRNPIAMADAIVEIVESDAASINRVTQEAHRLVKGQFNYDTSVQEFISLYESVVESHLSFRRNPDSYRDD
ncbi:glycosyltransferase family 4 protein [Winogradskyella sp. A3E31]|uniref:glycosyltransferase family 4 protein n=1 Tax=Winogradskyella sp. A3E31 TaxID=3349637 RepID=UPI00398AC408